MPRKPQWTCSEAVTKSIYICETPPAVMVAHSRWMARAQMAVALSDVGQCATAEAVLRLPIWHFRPIPRDCVPCILMGDHGDANAVG